VYILQDAHVILDDEGAAQWTRVGYQLPSRTAHHAEGYFHLERAIEFQHIVEAHSSFQQVVTCTRCPVAAQL
jgi:hypothetical protein